MNFFDKLFNRTTKLNLPRTGAKTQQAYLVKSGRIDAFQQIYTRINRGWLSSPVTWTREEFMYARDTSRLLCGFDPWAAKWLELMCTYTIGGDGMQFSPGIVTPAGELNDPVNKTLKKAWKEWCHTPTINDRYTFNELENLVVRSLARDGEAMLRIYRGKNVGNRYGMALYFLDSGRLDQNWNQRVDAETVIIQGVEYRRGAPIAYHIWNRYPDDVLSGTMTDGSMPMRERIPADEIIHIYKDEYGVDARGLPWILPAMVTLGRLNEYLNTHLQAMQTAASAPLVMRTDQPDVPQLDDVMVSVDSDGSGGFETRNSTPRETLVLDQVQIINLPLGKKLEALNVHFPQQGFDVAVKTYLQAIAAALHLSYASLTSDSSGESYSTVRHGSIIERDYWQSVQRWVRAKFHNRVYREWIKQAILTDALKLPTTDPTDYHEIKFNPRGFRWVDPLKDARAYLEMLQQGMITRGAAVGEYGGDWHENILAIQEEQEFAKKHGIPLPELGQQITLLTQIAELKALVENMAGGHVEEKPPAGEPLIKPTSDSVPLNPR